MDSNQAADLLRQAKTASTQGRQSGKWFARYLAIFGIVSIPLSLLTVWSLGRPTLFISLMIGWGIFVAATAAWSVRQRGAPRASHKISAAAFASWGVVWAVTVIVGATFLEDSLVWWLGGGVVMAAIMFTAAAYTARRAR